MKKKSLVIGFFVCLYDQIIKYVINSSFYYGKMVSIIPKFFYLTRTDNDGAAWSTFSGNRIFLIIVSLVALVFLIYLQKTFLDNKRNQIGFGLVLGGLVGNLIDRVFLGHVVDYMKFNFGSYEFPVFNLADTAIVIGFALLVYSIIKGEDKNEDNIS